jgi:hypothetical protein
MYISKRISKILLLAVMGLTMSACTTVVTKDYDQYLAKNQNEAEYKKANVGKSYYLTPQTEKHSINIKSAMAGFANKWVLEFKDVADETVKSSDFQKAFGELQKTDEGGMKSARTLVIDLKNYEFYDKRAHIDLELAVKDKGKNVFKKTYKAKGPAQGGKMFWGGAMAMKNAVQQSTKHAMDKILTSFSKDAAKKLK